MLAISSKGHGTGVKPDESVDKSVIATTAELIQRQPEAKREALIEQFSGYMASADVLERAGNAQLGDLVPLTPAECGAVEHHRTRTRAIDAGDGVEAGGFAGTVRANETENLPAPDLEAHRVQSGQPTKPDTEISGGQQRRSCHEATSVSSARRSRLRADFP